MIERIRKNIQKELKKKVVRVFPNPLMILERVVLVYKKGQIQHNTFRYFVISELRNILVPMKLLKIKNKKQDPIPKIIQSEKVF